MEKALVTTETKAKSQRSKHESLVNTEVQTQDSEYSQTLHATNTFYRSDGRGFDLSAIPVSTGPRPQDGISSALEDSSIESNGATPQEQAGTSLIVEDNATALSEGQMKKTDFLLRLRAEICQAIEPVLASVGQTTDRCPYLNFWLDAYQQKDAEHIERTLKKYAPDSAKAKTSAEYISIVVQRALLAAQIWARTGKLSGIPQGLPTTLPGGASDALASTKDDRSNPGQWKSTARGVSVEDDPVAIRNTLGDGHVLTSDVRSRMESAFGTGFSHVRTHTDNVASGLSGQLNARAFTIGNHVAFRNGEYAPGTIIGDALIAHELSHTIQQREAGRSVEEAEVGDARYNALEEDADYNAIGAVSRLWNKGKDGLKGIAAKARPSLKSGLKLQRCAASQTRTTTPAGATAAQTCGPSSVARTYVPNNSGDPPALGDREFGTTSKLAAFPAYAACQRDGGWHFYLTALDVQVRSAVQPRNFRTDVTSATDTVVTSASYPVIINDLRPNRTVNFGVSCAGNRWTDTTNTYSRRRTYWSYQFVVDHEAFHRTDWDSKYRPNLINAERQICAHEIPASQADSAAEAIQQERRTLDGFMANAYQQTCREYTPQQESRAYDHGAPRYQGLVDAIQARAQSQGWATPPPASTP